MSARFMRIRRWRHPLGLLGLAMLVLLPAVGTGYYNEDLVHSMIPGIIRFHGDTLGGRFLDFLNSNVHMGRFYPLTQFLHTTVHYLARDVVVYKALLIAGTILDVMLFYLLIRRLTGSDGFASLAGCLSIGLYQFRTHPDPVLGYYLQVQLVAAGLFASLLALQWFLEGRGRAWLLVGAVSYLVCALTYEISYPFFVIHLLLILHARPGWRSGLLAALPFLMVVGACGLATVVVRRLFHDEYYYVHHVNHDPRDFLTALGYQVSAALPLSYFLADPHALFGEVRGASTLFRWLLRPEAIVVVLATMIVAYNALRHRGEDGECPASWWRLMLGIGLLLTVLPALLISTSPSHQAEFAIGVGWVPVLIQCFGSGLILATLIWRLLALRLWGGPFACWKCLGIVTLVAAATGLTYQANSQVALCLNAPPGTKYFRAQAARCYGVWYYHRLNLETALHAGLLEDVPEYSKILLAHEYPFWHDSLYSLYFYAAHASKVLATFPPSAQDPGSPAFQELQQFLISASVPIREGAAYRLRDVCLGRRSGYVILSRFTTEGSENCGLASSDREFRLFVRHPHLFKAGSVPEFLLVGDPPPAAGGQEHRTYLRLAKDLPMIRAGRDWGLFALRSEIGRVSPDTLRLVFDPGKATASLYSEKDRFAPDRGTRDNSSLASPGHHRRSGP